MAACHRSARAAQHHGWDVSGWTGGQEEERDPTAACASPDHRRRRMCQVRQLFCVFYQSTGKPAPIWLSSDRHGVCLPYQRGLFYFYFYFFILFFFVSTIPGRRSRVILTYRTSASFEPHLPHVLCWTGAAFGQGDEMVLLRCAKIFGPGAAPTPQKCERQMRSTAIRKGPSNGLLAGCWDERK